MINQALLSELFNQPWHIENQYAISQAVAYFFAYRSGVPPKEGLKPVSAYAVNQSGTTYNDSEIQPGSIGIITIDGPIVKNSDWEWGIKGTEEAAREFLEFENNPNIIGTVFALNTGGGAVYAVKPLTDVLEARTKPLVFHSKEYLCSAGMRIAAHGDKRIVYHPQGIIGSIGTMSSMSNWNKMFEKWGVEFHDIYATLSDLKNKTYTDALEGKYDRMRNRVLNPMNEDFHAEMKSLMGHLISSKYPEVWKGETYMAEEAVKIGLISRIGKFEDALQEVIDLSASNPKPKSNSQNNNNLNMKTEKILALASKPEATEEELAEANAELTAIGVTGYSIVAESVLEQGVQVTNDLAAANQTIAGLNTQLTTEKGKVTSLTTENETLKQKLAQGPAAVAPVVEAKDPVTEKTADQETRDALDALPHNRAIANNPLFNS